MPRGADTVALLSFATPPDRLPLPSGEARQRPRPLRIRGFRGKPPLRPRPPRCRLAWLRFRVLTVAGHLRLFSSTRFSLLPLMVACRTLGFTAAGFLLVPSLCGADSRALTTDHELENGGFLPKICASVSWQLNEAPFRSIYGSSIDAPLDGKAGWVDEMFQGITCVEKVACASQEGDTLFCKNGHRMEAFEDENQHSRMDMGSRFNLSFCEEASSESLKSLGPRAQKEMQQISRNCGTSEFPTEGDVLFFVSPVMPR